MIMEPALACLPQLEGHRNLGATRERLCMSCPHPPRALGAPVLIAIVSSADEHNGAGSKGAGTMSELGWRERREGVGRGKAG
jgi:hypothetical protein